MRTASSRSCARSCVVEVAARVSRQSNDHADRCPVFVFCCPSHCDLFPPFLFVQFLVASSLRTRIDRIHTRKNQTQFICYYILLSHGPSDRFSCNPATCTNTLSLPFPPINHLYSAKNSILIYIASSVCFSAFRSTRSLQINFVNFGIFFLMSIIFFSCHYSVAGSLWIFSFFIWWV